MGKISSNILNSLINMMMKDEPAKEGTDKEEICAECDKPISECDCEGEGECNCGSEGEDIPEGKGKMTMVVVAGKKKPE